MKQVDVSQMIPKLKRLRLPGIAEKMEERIREAGKERWSYSEFLDLLLTDEIDRRDYRMGVQRLGRSGLDPTKTLETFEFSFNRKINEEMIREFATCSYLEKKENIFLLGPSGVGKSHLAQALGHQACRKKKEVYYYRTSVLLKWIHSGRGDGTEIKRMSKIVKSPLVILDDFGLQPLTKQEQEDLYEIICSRNEVSSTIITSNRDIGEWSGIFENPLIGSAAIDRLVYRANSIVIEGDSYRLSEYKKRMKKKGVK